MYFDEFKEYVENNSRAHDYFFERALDYQNAKNARRTPAHKRWKEQKVLKEVETMWTNVVKQLYDNIKLNGKFRKRFMHQEEIDEWVSFMNEHEILESFADSMAEIEFE
ncbi:TPA: hypothetical protein ACHRZB_001673 [Streptococcus pyogenes]|uniref:hypothetical protein n=1 Tax=Streptococcus pyogenes TaxID=1314 RepID=UPI002B0936DE|nr:hypothetical protein [Streptococcus pyogenes]HEQ3723089.1 hypothetical protein [Streptococcus pyogenes]HEQ3738245.1 hypothetical protein [Streptococcus pyogenes]HEQ4054402.1 hypothetical protein [Streptococcus pyogenes]HEQ4131011.1 hypothetical protein [Streptococcus pyogenes]